MFASVGCYNRPFQNISSSCGGYFIRTPVFKDDNVLHHCYQFNKAVTVSARYMFTTLLSPLLCRYMFTTLLSPLLCRYMFTTLLSPLLCRYMFTTLLSPLLCRYMFTTLLSPLLCRYMFTTLLSPLLCRYNSVELGLIDIYYVIYILCNKNYIYWESRYSTD